MKIVKDENNIKDPYAFVEKVLQCQDEIDTLIEQCFSNRNDFLQARSEAFKTFLNEQPFTAPYMA